MFKYVKGTFEITAGLKSWQEIKLMSTRNILIADDDAEDRELLEEVILLQEPQMKIHGVANGFQVIEYLEKCAEGELPNIIVLDYNMPLLNGAELLHKIFDNEKFNQIPVVIVSTSNAQKHVEQCISIGAKDYFVKPTDMAGLNAMSEKILALSY